MAEKRQLPLNDLKEPKTMGGLVSNTANLEAVLRNFRLETVGIPKKRSASIGCNRRGEEVEKTTGYVYPLPPAE